ncbi:PREDICTED: copper transport protein ATOX1-like [Acropora digitifera]|uniref:copper transport protein ATOX1-like n=1 Tax=Acropora digitifera TaxID=70779 RepID=UPI00077A60A6|nr:PREDICTED: copper transport protein ATOX1-like [Acropora digitifera]
MATCHEFQVEMTCGGCSGAVTRVLNKKGGVDKIEIDMEKQRVYVTSALSADELLETIKKAGKSCSYIGSA